jgi:ubiquitin carboxyl-terminal hydrolase 4/11/15
MKFFNLIGKFLFNSNDDSSLSPSSPNDNRISKNKTNHNHKPKIITPKSNNLRNNQINNISKPKEEYISIFGEIKEGLQNLKLDNKINYGGLVALGNIGNTCYMNSSLQCLSNCKILTNYFLQDYYKPFVNRKNSIGSKGKIVEAYAELIKHLWYGQNKMIEPYRLKYECGIVCNLFADYNQQDSQEFISFLLNELHEDLNTASNKPYIEKNDNLVFNSDFEEFNYNKNNFLDRNQSIIIDLFYGMFKSTIVCPNENCKKVSKSYEPYSFISIPINLKPRDKEIYVYFIFEKFEYQIIRYKMSIPYDMDIYSFRKKVEYLFKIDYNTFEIYKYKDNELMVIHDENIGVFDFLGNNHEIYLYQIPNIVFDKTDENTIKIYEELEKDHLLLENREKEYNQNTNVSLDNILKLEIDREKWIKCFCYIYSYNEEGFPNDEISLPKIFYINIDWNNSQIYNYIFEKYKKILDCKEIPENLKEQLFPDLDNVTQKLLENNTFNLDFTKHNQLNYPYMILYEKFAQINENSINKHKNFKELILPSSQKKKIIYKILENLKSKGLNTKEYQLILKLVFLPDYKDIVKILNEPKIMNSKENMFITHEGTFDIKLTSLLEQLGKSETLTEGNEWYCDKCKKSQSAEKKMEICSCPEILILHLKRFREGNKLNYVIDYPIKGLNMGQYIKYNENDNIYDLFAVTNHQGNYTGGHYFAYSKNFLNNKWFEFDDEYMKTIKEDEIVSENSYILFYQKRNSKFESIYKESSMNK